MGRHGLNEYDDFCDDDANLSFGRWRGQVESAIRGKDGQKFLKELVRALDALPEKKLISESLQVQDGAVCALGAVARARGIDMTQWTPGPDDDPDDFHYDQVHELAGTFNVAHQLISEIIWENDEGNYNSPEHRWAAMRKFAINRIKRHPVRRPGRTWEVGWGW
jgi:hypothetical protein